MRLYGIVMGATLLASTVFADTLSVKMLPGEHWWGVCDNFGREMPFTEKSVFSCDLRSNNYSHQSLSFLCSDKGRAVWCAEPVGVRIKDGEIALESDRGEVVLKEDAGSTLSCWSRRAPRSLGGSAVSRGSVLLDRTCKRA